jgi:hypothetical protein
MSYHVLDLTRQLRAREDDFVSQAAADELDRLLQLVAELEDKLLATGQWHAQSSAGSKK